MIHPIDSQGHWNFPQAEAFRQILLDEGIHGVVFSRDPENRFMPKDMDAYKRVFEAVFENRFDLIMVPRYWVSFICPLP